MPLPTEPNRPRPSSAVPQEGAVGEVRTQSGDDKAFGACAPLELGVDQTGGGRRTSSGIVMVYSMGSPASSGLSFLEAFFFSLPLPLLPSIAGLEEERIKAALPLQVALLAGAWFLGRAAGYLWWFFRHGETHPSVKGELLSMRDLIKAGLLYFIIYLSLGLTQAPKLVWGFFGGQVASGYVTGGYACRMKTSFGARALGIIVGPLLGGLLWVLQTPTTIPNLEKANATPFLGVAVGSIVVLAIVIGLCMVIATMEPAPGAQDNSYRRLDLIGGGSSHETALSVGRSGRDEIDYDMNGVVVVPGGRNSSSSFGNDHGIPQRYVRGCQGDMVEAGRRWRETVLWRTEQKVDQILQEPQPNFRLIKECYPHYLHRRDKQGHPVYYELLGMIDLKRLKAAGVTIDEMLRYYVFLTEYIWSVVEPDQEYGALVSVLDVEGVGLFDLKGDALEFLKGASRVVQQHYVERSFRMFIVNAPSWFSVMWRVISPMLNENTRRKISIVGGKDQARAMLECIDAENLPAKYGGRDALPLGQDPEELRFQRYVDEVNNGAGRPTIPADPIVRASMPTTQRANFPVQQQGGGGSLFPLMSFKRSSSSSKSLSLMGGGGLSTSNTNNPNGPRALLRWGQRLLNPIRDLLNRPAAEPAPEANLGRDNKFVYDQSLGQWVLQEDEEVLVMDESEERLIRAIQAAHGAQEEPPSQPSATHRAISGLGPPPALPKVSPIRGPHTFGSFLRARNNTAITPFEFHCPTHQECSRSMSFSIVLAWRCLSLSILVVMPLWLSPNGKSLDLPPVWMGALFSMAGVVTLLAWAVFLYLISRRSSSGLFRRGSLAPPLIQRVLGLALLFLAISLFFVIHVVSSRVSLLSISTITLAVQFLAFGVSSNWAVSLYAAIHKQETYRIRYRLTPALQLVDVLGSFLGPSLYYLLDYRASSTDARWSLSYLDVITVTAAVSVLFLTLSSFTWGSSVN